jgi:hypothetical protein
LFLATLAYGLGALFHLANQKFNPRLDVAIKASYHAANYCVSDTRVSIRVLSMEVLISGVAIEGISGYVNFGYY